MISLIFREKIKFERKNALPLMNFYSNDTKHVHNRARSPPSLHNFYPSNDTVPRLLKFMNFNPPSKPIFKRKERRRERGKRNSERISRCDGEEKLKNSISNLLRETFATFRILCLLIFEIIYFYLS